MIYHVHIDKLVIYPASQDEQLYPETRCLYSTINEVPVPVAIPNDIAVTKPAIRAYLRAHQTEILEAYERNKPLQPTHNYDVGMDFDWNVP